MTQHSRRRRRIRARMQRDGVPYNVARQADERAQRRLEPHYRFTAPRTIQRVGSDGTVDTLRPLPHDAPSFAWGYAGSGPNAAARAVVADASGDCDNRLAMAFVEDNLLWELDDTFAITVGEVVAWRAEREPELHMQPPGRSYSASELGELMRQHLDDPNRLTEPWWRRARRRTGGEPYLGS